MRTPVRRSRSVFESNHPRTGINRMTVGVHDLGRPEAGDGLVQCLDAEVRLQRVRDAPGQHLARVPVHDRHQIEEPSPHPQIGDVRSPNLIGPIHPQPAQQVGIRLVPLRRLAGVGLLVDRLRPIRRIRRRMRFSFTRWPSLRRCQVICRTPKNGVSRNCSTIQRVATRPSAI